LNDVLTEGIKVDLADCIHNTFWGIEALEPKDHGGGRAATIVKLEFG
jgi:hypothetical protein